MLLLEAVKALRKVNGALFAILTRMKELAKTLPEYPVVRAMGGVGDIRKFYSGKALIAYAGIDPPPYESGKFIGTERHISKRGSTTLRKIGYEVMRCVKTNGRSDDPAVYDFMYLNGYGFAKIKYELERQGRLTAMGKEKWFYSVISNILNNSFYCGIMKYHKEYTPDFLEQKKIKNSGEVEYTYVKGRHQPIVSEDEFQRVQDILNEKRGSMKSLQHNQKKPRGHAPSKSVWSRLLVCECGKKLNCHVWNRKNGAVNAGYLCYSQTNHGTVQQKKNHGIKTANSCDTPMIPDWKLKMMAVHIFKNYISDADKVLSLTYEMLEKHIADSEDEPDIATIIEAQNKELEKWEKKLDNYIEMRADGEISKEVFLAKTGDINDRIAEIKKYLMSLQQDNSEVEERDYESLLEALKKELESYVDFESSTEIPDQILEAFIEKIVVHRDSFEWHLRIPTVNTRCEISEEEGMTDEVESVIEFLEKEEVPTSQKLLISEFTMTKDDALKYMYSIDTRKRVHRWKDFEVKLYA